MRTAVARAAIAVAVGCVVHAGTAAAQRPDLNGIWKAEPGAVANGLGAAPTPVLGPIFGLALDQGSAVLTRPIRGESHAVSFLVSGARTSYRVPGRLCEGERTFHETVAWAGDTLVMTIVGLTPAGGGRTTEAATRRLLRLEAPGRLVVEGTIVQGGQSRQVGTVYTRTTEALPPVRAKLPVAGIPATMDGLAWLGATWIGTTNGVTTEERWTPAASGGMMAVSRTLRGDALAAFEFLCIAERDGTLVYLAMPDARTPATLFVLTALTATSATFENPTHDFPVSIRYALNGAGNLETTIAGPGGSRPRTVTLSKQTGAPPPDR